MAAFKTISVCTFTVHRWCIITFDWTTQQYTKQASRLLKDRLYCACSLLNASNGQKLVAIADKTGWKFGIRPTGLSRPWPVFSDLVMISVKQNSELIFYETAYAVQGIWKYYQVNNTWSKIGKRLGSAGCCFEVLPVTGISCP